MLLPTKGKSFDPTEIPQAVKKAGFSPGKVEVTVVGTLATEDDLLRLDMPGRVQQIILAGGAKAEELGKQRNLIGQRLRVTGTLHGSHGDQPPGITVECWEHLSRSP